MTNSATPLQNVEGVVMATVFVIVVLGYLIRRLQRSRPDFRVGVPVFIGFGLRLAAIAGISATGLSSTLRGGDETTFLNYAIGLAHQPINTNYIPHSFDQLHVVVFALELRLGFLTQGAMRIIQVGIALFGAVLILAAVNDLASGRAARFAAWLLAFEPATIFFNSALHKDPLMELATGLVVFGGTRIWLRLDLRGILICAFGGLIAVETRTYAGWFLIAAAVLVLFHAAIRGLDRPMRAMPLIYAVVIAGFVAAPAIIQASSKKNLQVLQNSQNANATGAGEGNSTSNGSNLALEQVNYSSRGAILKNLPKRIRDVLLRPYPWQLGDNSQRFGAIGTLFAYAILILLARYAWLSRGRVLPSIAPILYPMLFLLVAYSLSAGNAGTGFRYRTHIVVLAVAAMAVLREQAAPALARRRAQKKGTAPAVGAEPFTPSPTAV